MKGLMNGMDYYHQILLANNLLRAACFTPVVIALGVLVWAIVKWDRSRSPEIIAWSGLAVIVFFFIGGFVSNEIRDPKSPDADSKATLHTLQIAVDYYAKEHGGYYPASIQVLIGEYLTQTPFNPYTGKAMNEIAFSSTPSAGDFTYIPVTDGTNVIGYYMIAYGSMDWPGDDVNGDGVPDHVIFVVSSIDTANEHVPATADIPPLADLLKAMKG
jgi:hypothetical protein